MIIRPATPTDAPSISALIRGVAHCFTLHPDGAGAEDFLRTISPEGIESCITAPNFHYLAGFMEGELVGVVAIRDNHHLHHLFVSPKFHHRGIAKKLWRVAMNEAVQRGNPGAFTVNSTPFAVPVYASFGFEISGPKVETKGISYVPMQLSSGGNPPGFA